MPAFNPFPYARYFPTDNPPHLNFFIPNAAQNYYAPGMYFYTYPGANQTANYQPAYGGPFKFFAGDSGQTTGDSANTYGGDFYVKAGDGEYATGDNSYQYGGNIDFYAGDSFPSNAVGGGAVGGHVYLYGGRGDTSDAYSKGGVIRLKGGDAAMSNGFSQGGSIYLESGAGYNSDGDIEILAGATIGSSRMLVGAYGPGSYISLSTNYGDLRLAVAGNILTPNLPNADPGVPSALWFDNVTNIVMRSP